MRVRLAPPTVLLLSLATPAVAAAPAPSDAVPVVVGVVTRADVPVELSGLSQAPQEEQRP